MQFLVINGPNMNMLGVREPATYGEETYDDLCARMKDWGEKNAVEITCFQSNSEGALIDAIQDAYEKMDGIVINPAAYSHTSIALLDALLAVGIPAVEVHVSDPDKREAFRHTDYVRNACIACVKGQGTDGYVEALDILFAHCTKKEDTK